MSTLTECAKITRSDGVIVGMTSLDSDISLDGVLYRSISGYTPSAIDQGRDLSVTNLDFQGLLDSTGVISRDDLLNGKYDNAKVHIFIVDYVSGAIVEDNLFNGRIGNITLKNGAFHAELRSIHQLLKNDLTQKYSATCRAEFGDTRCGKNLAAFTVSGTVTAVADRLQFSDSSKTQADGYFKYGVVSWTSGGNAGNKYDVVEFSAGNFRLFVKTHQPIALGDTFTVSAGCDKIFNTCKTKYANVVNFRGEPFLPGRDQILSYPDAR